MNDNVRPASPPRGSVNKVAIAAHPGAAGKPAPKTPPPYPVTSGPVGDELARLKAAAEAVHQIRLSAQHELELSRKMRAEAQRYQQETETQARSRAHQLILHTRLETQKEIEDLIRSAGAEIQKVLADIRAIRITAQEELATQQKFTNAAKLRSLALSLQQDTAEVEENSKKQLAYKK